MAMSVSTIGGGLISNICFEGAGIVHWFNWVLGTRREAKGSIRIVERSSRAMVLKSG